MEMIGKETQINFKSCGQQKKQRQMKFQILLYVIAKEGRCETNKCTCFFLKFTDLCNTKSCSNVNTDEDAEATEKDDYKNCDDDDWEDMIDDEEDLPDNGDI